jgi:Ca-activated chloride channel family protein
MLCTQFEKKSLLVIVFVLLSFASFANAQTKITEGSLEVFDDKGKSVGLCPLKHTDVKADISGFIARVTVTQEFVNPFDRKIEAVYAFPMSQNAAVDDMTMIIGERVIRGKIMKREEAAAVYNQAKAQGKVASLLEQQRPNIFTQSVANIVPNAQIKIVISYVEYLKYNSGSYEFGFPMTVGKRYIPMSQEMTEGVSKITPPHSERPGHDISLEVKIDAGVPLVSVSSSNHKIESNAIDASASLVRLENQNEIPNKDFVLRYKVAGEKIQDALLVHKDQRGGFFTMILQPPDRVMPEDVNPKEIVFVLDTSGSMNGFPIDKAKECMMLALNNLYPNDTFNLITFAGETSILFDEPVPATSENLAKAKKFLASRKSDGGTEMMKAIKAAFEPSDAQNHVRIVCFMTDGEVYNDNEIIAEVQKHPNARVFSFGIGSSVNRFLLDKIAEEGRGEAEYVSPNDDGSAAAKKFHERIRNPLLTDVAVDWNGLPVADVYPKRIPDLFSAKPVVLTGRFNQSAKGSIRLRGMMAGNYYEREISVEFPEQESSHDVLATLWARQRVDDITKNDYVGAQDRKMKDELKDEITQLGIEFRLLTQFTSFVAVDESSNTGSDVAEKVDVASATPDNAPTNGALATVEVTSGVTTNVNSTESQVSTTVTTKSITALPTMTRNAYSLVGISPNVSTNDPTASGAGYAINGQRAASTTVLLDGGENANTFTNGVNRSIPLDATGEFRIITSNASAEYGRASGGIVNVVTKAGTNEFHGSLFDEFGNGVLNANNFFANSRGLEKPSAKLNLFGGTLGGPIQKHKQFFFVAFENMQQRQPDFALTEVPSLSSHINSSLLNAFPLPNGANTANGFSGFASNFLNPVSHNALAFRYDWNITEKTQLFTRYNFANSNSTTHGEDGFSLNTLKRENDNTNMLKGKLTYLFSSSLIMDISTDYSRASLAKSFFFDNFGGANTQGLSTNNQAFTKFDLFGKNAVIASGNKTENSLQKLEINNDWSKISGNHTLRFGFSFRHQWFVVGTQPTERSVLFSGATNSIAERVNLFNRVPKFHPRFNDFSSYFNDSWRAKSRLAFNLGLRWEVAPPPSNADAQKPLALTDIEQPFNISNNSKLWRTTYNNFSPRVGLAWDVFGDGKTSMRGGFGLYYELDNTANVLQLFNHSFPFVSGTSTLSNTNNLFVGFDPKLKLPYARTWNASFEREVFRNSVLSFAYSGSQGQRLFLTKTFVGQDPNFALVRLTTNDAESDYHAMLVSFESTNFKGFDAKLSYMFAKSLDNYSSDSPFAAIMVSDNPLQDRGASDFDTRHKFSGLVSYSMPNEFRNEKLSLLMRGWMFSSLFNLRTALPMNVVYARVNSFGVTYWRPDLLTNTPLYLNNPQEINSNAFMIPNSFRQGTLGRNSLRGFPLYQFDFAVSRTFQLKQDVRLMLKLSALNVLNQANFAAPVGNDLSIASRFPSGAFLSNPIFGKTTSLLGNDINNGARALQVSFKLTF